MPTLNDLISDLNSSTIFSKLDLSNAYHQLELDEASRQVTAFTTHAGIWHNKRLLFGVNAAAKIFQNTIAEILPDIPGVWNLSDDIIIFGKTQAEHNISIQATPKRLEERGTKLNKGKCKFSVHKLTFFSDMFSAEGLKAG